MNNKNSDEFKQELKTLKMHDLKELILEELCNQIFRLYNIKKNSISSNNIFRTILYSIYSKPETHWICDWIQNIISSKMDVYTLKVSISNSEDLKIEDLKKMNKAAKYILSYLNEHNFQNPTNQDAMYDSPSYRSFPGTLIECFSKPGDPINYSKGSKGYRDENHRENLKDVDDLRWLIRLFYFARILEISQDNNFYYYLRNIVDKKTRELSIGGEIFIEANDWEKDYDDEIIRGIFLETDNFTEEAKDQVRNGTIEQKISAISDYLDDKDELDPFNEVYNYLKVLVYQLIDILANNIEKLKKLKDNSNFDSNVFYKQIENIVVNDGKENCEAASWIIDRLKWCDEMYDKVNLKKRKVLTVSETITNSYESGDLNAQDIEEFLKASNKVRKKIEKEAVEAANRFFPSRDE